MPLPSCTVEFRVRYAETDQMGVVYHANYLPWCEIGRTELIRRLWGTSYADLERAGTLLAVADAELRYHRPARYDDLVRVRAGLEWARSRGVRFVYHVSRVEDDGTETRLVTAATTLIAIGRDGATRTLPPELVRAFRDALAQETPA